MASCSEVTEAECIATGTLGRLSFDVQSRSTMLTQDQVMMMSDEGWHGGLYLADGPSGTERRLLIPLFMSPSNRLQSPLPQ